MYIIYIYIHIYILYVYCIGYVMPRVLYQVYNHRARGRGDSKPDIARVGIIYFMTSKSYSLTKPQTTQCTYQTAVHVAYL